MPTANAGAAVEQQVGEKRGQQHGSFSEPSKLGRQVNGVFFQVGEHSFARWVRRGLSV
jgi:hypothetical protein